MLEDAGFRDQLRMEIENYFLHNWGSTDSRLTEWEAFKVVVRGCCISGAAGVRPVLLGEVQRHEERLRILELKVPVNPAQRPLLVAERGRWAEATERLSKFDYRAYVERMHDEQDKAGRMLAWLANPNTNGTTIVEIRDEGGDKVRTQNEINTVFASYYKKLYARPEPLDPTELAEYLDSLPLRSRSPETEEEIGELITQELKAVLKKNG